MKDKAAIVIAALMITSIAFAFSTTVSATHEPTVEVTPAITKASELVDFEIKVTNAAGSSPIIKVEVTLPFTVDDWVGTLMADSMVGTSGTSVGADISETLPITLDATNNQIKLNVDGGGAVEYTITEGTYDTETALVAAINTAIDGSGATASWDTDHIVFTSNTTGPDSSVAVTAGTHDATATLGFSDPTETAGTLGTLEAPETVLPAGTEIPITTAYDLTLAENTPITIEEDSTIDIVAGITVIVPAGTVTGTGGKPLRGPGATAGTSVGAAITLPVAIITGSNDTLKLAVDGDTAVEITIAGAADPGLEYALGADLEGAINTAIGATALSGKVTASWTETEVGPPVKGYITFTSDTLGFSDTTSKISSVAVTAGTTDARETLGFSTPTETPGTPGFTLALKYETRVTLDAETSLIKPEVKLLLGSPVTLPAENRIELAATVASNLPDGVTLASDTDAVLGAAVDAAKLCENTEGEIGPSEITTAKLIEGTTCPLVADNTTTFPATAKIKVPEGTKVVLALTPPIDNETELSESTQVTLWEASTVVLYADVGLVPIDSTAEFGLPPDNVITATLTGGHDVTLQKNTEIKLPVITDGVTLKEGAKLALPIPSNWNVTTAAGTTATWENANADGKIGPGDDMTFSIRATTGAEAEYLWTITTTAVDESVAYRTLMTTVDSTSPELTVSMEPYRIGAGPATIKVVASEVLSNLDNVYCQFDDNAEHIGDPTKLIDMESTDNITWTGILTIPENGLWDENLVDIEILGVGYKDLAGNEGSNVSERIHDPATWLSRRIDTVSPVLPVNLEMTGTAPFDNEVSRESQLITGIAKDNLAGEASAQDNLTVRISVNDTVYETKSLGAGAFVKEIELTEGPNTIKVWVVDRVGNAGPENEQTVFLDTIEPTISMVSVAGEAYEDNVPVKENTPTIVLTITDPGYPATGLGVETFTVELQDADGKPIDTLENATPWDKETGRFENTIPEQGDGFYRIYVEATDVVGNPNSETFWFEIDVIAPTLLTTDLPDRPYPDPVIQKTATYTITGEGLTDADQIGATATIYKKVDTTYTPLTTVTVASDGTFSCTIAPGEGIFRLYVSLTDTAGNESSKVLWGTLTIDTVAPTLDITTISETTDEPTVLVSGTVDDLTATVVMSATLLDQRTLVVDPTTGAFSYAVPLSEGTNIITVVATDGAGNRDIETLTIERTVTPVATYAIIIVIVALIIAAIAIFRKR